MKFYEDIIALLEDTDIFIMQDQFKKYIEIPGPELEIYKREKCLQLNQLRLVQLDPALKGVFFKLLINNDIKCKNILQ